MTEITILSGKGGTGKTSITAAIASLANNAIFCDNDVDAANLHLVFAPETQETHTFDGAYVATIHKEQCTQCGICTDHCRFNAIRTEADGSLHIDPYTCEGCRLCERVCPEKAITSERSTNNYWYVSSSRFGTLVHATMGPGEENSGKLVTRLRSRAREIAKETQAEWIINDGPPGIGCAAISSLSGVDAVVIVTEPSMSGFHDLERIVELIRSFRIPAFAMINKYDLHPELTDKIRGFLQKNDIQTIAMIPFSETFVHAMIEGRTVIEHQPGSRISDLLTGAWKEISHQ